MYNFYTNKGVKQYCTFGEELGRGQFGVIMFGSDVQTIVFSVKTIIIEPNPAQTVGLVIW